MELKSPYCTIEEVQAETENSTQEVVPLLISAINKASRWIEWYCSRDWIFHDHTQNSFIVPPGWVIGDKLYFPWPVVQLDKVEVVRNGQSTEYATSELVIIHAQFAREDIVSFDGRNPLSHGGIMRLTGKWGYTQESAESVPADIPADIARAATRIAAIFSGKSKKEIVGFDGNRNSIVLKDIPKDTLATLNSWRVGRVVL